MAPFYVYLNYDRDDWHPHLITFINRETADEWWRMISTSPSPYASNVERVSPHLYFQNNARKHDVLTFLSCSKLPDAQRFRKKLLVSRLQLGSDWKVHPITVPPTTTFTDHISGNWYFIRSKADPYSFWYFRTDDACLVCGDESCDAIHVSSEYRTKFCIRVRNLADNAQVPENFVMIGKDKISIAAPIDYTVHIDDKGKLKATAGYQGRTDLLFNDLKNRFITRARRQVNGEVWEYAVPVQRGLGETWELID